MVVLAASRDTGGTNGVLPGERELQKDFDVVYLARGRAIEILTASGEKFETLNSPDEVLAKYPNIAGLVTSMCYSGNAGVGRDLVPRLRGLCPTVAIQDLWGAQMKTSWKDPLYRPDYLCVNDRLGSEIAVKAWPDFESSRIVEAGFPALDKYQNYDSDLIASEGRMVLNIRADLPVVMFGGQGDGSAEALAEVVAALNEIDQTLYFIPRGHPNMKSDYAHEVEPWNKALGTYKGQGLIRNSQDVKTPAILALSSVVISMYSTLLLEAAVLRKPNIAILYPDSMARLEFEREAGGILDDPATVSLGCTAKATNRDNLKDLLTQALNGDLERKLRREQEKYLQLDGKNARRIADFIRRAIHQFHN